MIPTTTQIADLLNDLVTHAEGWARTLRIRAAQAEMTGQNGSELHEAAEDISDAGRSFRWRAAQPETDISDLLSIADRSLRRAPALRDVIMTERDAALTDAPDDASWLTHELNVLDRLVSARRDLITLPPMAETPMGELSALKALSTLLGREIQADFDGTTAGGGTINVIFGRGWDDMPDGVALEACARVTRLADRLIRCDIPAWDEAPGAEGRLVIRPDEDPWLDAVDHAEDWLLERTVDLEELAETGWDASADTAPEGAPEP